MAAKISKASVNYRPASKPARSCGTCEMFRPSDENDEAGKCTLVAGLIHASDTCDRWYKKGSK